MTLAALLEELKEVDAETSEDIGDIANVIRIQADGSFSVDSDDSDFIIQGCIQRACERRGWRECHGTWNGYPEAYIFYSPDNCSISLPHVHDSRAEALLAAYIAAVRGEAKL